MLENEAEHPRRRESWNPELKVSNNETFNFVDSMPRSGGETHFSTL